MRTITNLRENEIKVIKTIAEIKRGSILDISKTSGIARTTIYNFIDRLVKEGFLNKEIINGRARYSVGELAKETRIVAISKKKESVKNYSFISNKRELKKMILDTLIKNQNKKVDWIIDSKTSTEILGNRFFERYVEISKEKNIFVRVLRSPLSRGAHKYHSAEAIMKNNRIVRLGQKTVPFHGTVAIWGSSVLVVSNKSNGVGYFIEDDLVADTFRSLFLGLWKYSKPLGEDI